MNAFRVTLAAPTRKPQRQMNVSPGQFEANTALPIGDRLRQLRQLRGLTLRELAEQVGVTATALHSWETGRRNPKLKHLQAFADALKLTQSELLLSVAGEGGEALAVAPAGNRRRNRAGGNADRRLAEVVAGCKERISLAAGISPERVRIVIEV